MLLEILLVLLSSLFVGGFIYRRVSGRCTSTLRLDGKTIIITGGSAGIGKATAFALARKGARVILGCRNLTKAQKVADDIKANSGNNAVEVEKLDVSDLDSVRKFAEVIKKKEKAIHVLINNAGVGIDKKIMTSQGLELTMATNHYGPFLLTNLLLDIMKATPSSRIVTVSSLAHDFSKTLDCEDLNFKNMSYGVWPAYSQSKLCNVLFTKELAQKLKGTGVTANCLHPGAVATEIFNKDNTLLGGFLTVIAYFGGKDSNGGAQTSIHLAASEEVEGITGKYFVDCKEAKCSAQASDAGLAKKLWETSEKHVDLKPTEIFY